MQIAVLETFLKIAEVGSFSRASQLLFISQPTVSARIQTLETSLGQKLFRRLNNVVELTQAGRTFLPYAQAVVRSWTKARQEIALPQGFIGILTVGAPPSLWCDYLLEHMAAFQTKVSTVAFNAVVADAKTVLDKLDAGEIDVAVLHEPTIKTDWSTRKLFADSLVLVSTSPRQLVRWDPRYVFIDWGASYREQHFRAYPVDDTPLVTFSDASIALSYLLNVGGSAYLPQRWLDLPEYRERLFPVPGAPVFERDVFMVTDSQLTGTGWRSEAIETLFT
ncbi:LysR family transcriptional regulator [Paraburkholderia bonniea]|uniref:LysR family transcriptional regulator n=1 Tax=Paraburkholderia bonniea TaxID=2152891 RepID=UPI001290FE73|nr:LysR family transcriptional regulator [Paraburkholderia bonniea]WJF90860.1 LysR family transcriptional regulator [Paraburkholderia bonniea]WJF94174.1 LysR family transcriptional regulator [Paraburkholderia bonniea]